MSKLGQGNIEKELSLLLSSPSSKCVALCRLSHRVGSGRRLQHHLIRCRGRQLCRSWHCCKGLLWVGNHAGQRSIPPCADWRGEEVTFSSESLICNNTAQFRLVHKWSVQALHLDKDVSLQAFQTSLRCEESFGNKLSPKVTKIKHNFHWTDTFQAWMQCFCRGGVGINPLSTPINDLWGTSGISTSVPAATTHQRHPTTATAETTATPANNTDGAV